MYLYLYFLKLKKINLKTKFALSKIANSLKKFYITLLNSKQSNYYIFLSIYNLQKNKLRTLLPFIWSAFRVVYTFCTFGILF